MPRLGPGADRVGPRRVAATNDLYDAYAAVMAQPGLYVHVPFCARVCPYCDFAVLVGDCDRRANYVESLISEIALWGAEPCSELKGIDSLYFGGGTPSILELEQLERILDEIAASLPISAEPSIFLEANPEDVTPERLRGWSEIGVRTLSLGVQSFDERELEFLGRLHTAADGRRSLELALEAGFDTVSLDLIYGLPGQTEASWRRTLEAAVAQGPDHLSCYQLTLHDKTAFGVRKRRGELSEMPNDDQADLFLLTHQLLADAGLPAYEVSNFARSSEHRSRHNAKYWDHTPYLGLGPSAHSYAGGRRWWNYRALGAWTEALGRAEQPIDEEEQLEPVDFVRERLMLAMRTTDGLDLDELDRYGFDGSAVDERALEQLVERNLVTTEDRRLFPTLEGLAVADSLGLALGP